MAEKKEASLTLGFGDENSGSLAQLDMKIELPNQIVWDGDYTLHLFPAVPADLETSGGSTVGFASSSAFLKTISKEYLRFGGSDRVRTEYYAGTTIANTGLVPLSSVGISIDYQWDKFYSPTGTQVTPTFKYDTGTGEVVASVECYGLIKVSYGTTYRKIAYSPDVDRLGYWGTKTTFDTVLAFWNGAVAMYQFDVTRSNQKKDREICIEVYSELVIDESGTWEMPDDWPDMENGQKYNGRTGYAVPDKSAHLTTKRIHKYVEAEVGGRNTLYERDVSVGNVELPFDVTNSSGYTALGSHWFKPTYNITSSYPDGANTDLKLAIERKVSELKTEFGIK